MPTHLDVIEAEVLQLAPAERRRLLERLVADLDKDPATEAEWDAVAAARDAEMESGAVGAVSSTEALARLRARLA